MVNQANLFFSLTGFTVTRIYNSDLELEFMTIILPLLFMLRFISRTFLCNRLSASLLCKKDDSILNICTPSTL